MLRCLQPDQVMYYDESHLIQQARLELANSEGFKAPDLNWERDDYLRVFEAFGLKEVSFADLPQEVKEGLKKVKGRGHAFPSTKVLNGERKWPSHLHLVADPNYQVFYHFYIRDEGPARFGPNAPRKPVIGWSETSKVDDHYENRPLSNDMNAGEFLTTLTYEEVLRALINYRKSLKKATAQS